jgi:ankyrin repeat protein
MTTGLKILIFSLILFLIPAGKAYSRSDTLFFSHRLLLAAYDNSVDSVIYYLKKGGNPNYRDDHGQTALFYAVQNNNKDMVELLEFNGANINIRNHDGTTPLSLAVWLGYFDIAEYLCYKGADPNKSDIERAIPLHYSAYFSDYFTTDMLLFYKSKVNYETFDKNTPLHLAAIAGDTQVINLLLNHGAKTHIVNNNGLTPIKIAVIYNNLNAVKLLYKSDTLTHSSDSINALISTAIANKSDSVALYLLSTDEVKPVTKNNKTNPLNIALSERDKAMTASLKARGYKSGFMPFYTGLRLSTNISFNKNDTYFDFSAGAYDAKYSILTGIDIGTRFKRKPVIISAPGNIWYQLYERRNYLSVFVIKYFHIPGAEREIVLPFAGADLQFHSGNYKGSDIKLNKTFAFTFKGGMSFNLNPFYAEIAYNYRDYNIYGFSKHFISIGAGVRIDFYYQPEKFKPEWL